MNKNEFISSLATRLSFLPQNEINKSLEFYSEMIDDRIEDGMSEEEAVAALGSIDELAENAMLDTSLPVLVKAKMKSNSKKRTLRGWQIVLIVIGFPFWLPILIAIVAMLFAVYATVWSVIISMFAVVIGLIAGGLLGIGSSIVSMPLGFLHGLFSLGAFIACVGIGMLLFFPVKSLSKILIKLTVSFGRAIKRLFINKEAE